MKLQLKRSNVLENGSAKEPTAAQVEFGELCVNYNTSDPALFIKDSNDVIIRIAGAGSVGEGETPSGPILPDTGNKPGDVFFNETNNTLYYWNGSDWVPIASQENAADIFVGTFDEVDAAIAVDDRANGLLLWETTEGQLYIWYIDADTKQWVQAVPASGGGGGGSSVSVLPNAPSVAAQGDLWYCTSDGRLYVYYDDNATSQWVDASPDDVAPVVHSGEIWPSTATEDDLFFNTTDGRLYIYYNDGDSLQWVDASPDTQNYTDDWVRNGTTLSPANAGDDVDLGTGDLSADAGTFSGGVEVDEGSNRRVHIYTTSIGTDNENGRINIVANNAGVSSQIALGVYGNNTTNSANLKARINTDGGATFAGSVSTGNGATVKHEGTTVGWYGVDTSSYNKMVVVCRGKDGTGAINGPYVNKGGNSWTTGSDLRMKEGLVKLGGGLEKVSNINAYIGNYKDDAAKHAFLVAQELQQVLPEAVDVPEDESEMMGIRYTEVIPLLVSALHDAKARIEALEAEVQQLKGGN